jgi:voltage-gated potassium channel
MNALRRSMARQGFGYVMLLTLIVALLGAAGMFAFENAREIEGGFGNYAEALWWTAMLLTSIGSEFWPQTMEGRLLCLLLALYGFAIFGYITATIATFFVGRDARRDDLAALSQEIVRLRRLLDPASTPSR